ncbi:MAG: isochorismate synthase DhbC [Roseiflexaceae bacterium]
MTTELELSCTTALAPLLEEYTPGAASLFATPQGALLGQGVYATVPSRGGPDELARLPARAAALLRSVKWDGRVAPLVIGALPFDRNAAARLVVPQTLRTAATPLASAPLDGPLLSSHTQRPQPSADEYHRSVERALVLLSGGSLDKVVLARTLLLSGLDPIDIRPLLHNLACHNHAGATFAVNLPPRPEAGDNPPPRTLVGASPELLVARRGREVLSHPLAGSAPRSADPAEDQRRAEALLASAKDQREHAVVVEAVVAGLRRFCRRVDAPPAPTLLATETMWHLGTPIRGELSDPTTTALELAAALHPTPAVCGFPTVAARAAIGALEPFERGFYSGAAGWCDAGGDGEWYVTIRCAEVEGRQIRLFAGAGIIPGSQPEAELAETTAKLGTMLRALGLERQREAQR